MRCTEGPQGHFPLSTLPIGFYFEKCSTGTKFHGHCIKMHWLKNGKEKITLTLVNMARKTLFRATATGEREKTGGTL